MLIEMGLGEGGRGGEGGAGEGWSMSWYSVASKRSQNALSGFKLYKEIDLPAHRFRPVQAWISTL